MFSCCNMKQRAILASWLPQVSDIAKQKHPSTKNAASCRSVFNVVCVSSVRSDIKKKIAGGISGRDANSMRATTRGCSRCCKAVWRTQTGQQPRSREGRAWFAASVWIVKDTYRRIAISRRHQFRFPGGLCSTKAYSHAGLCISRSPWDTTGLGQCQ